MVLGLVDYGIFEVGKWVDFVVWNVLYFVELFYWIGFNLFEKCIFGGV